MSEDKYFRLTEKEIPLYRGKLIVILTDDLERLRQEVPGFEGENIFAHTVYGNRNGWQGCFIILNFKAELQKVTLGTVAHEALHAAMFICDARGISVTAENDEAAAYLTGWVVDEIHSAIAETEFKISA